MPKELYLYSSIYDFVAQDLIAQMEDAGNSEDITLRMNTGGGSVYAGWGIAAKLSERTGKTTIKVDGAAMSMGAMICLYSDNVQALDTSTFMLHRADMMVEDEEDQSLLDKVNKDLRAKMEGRIDNKKLKELKGLNIKNIFEDEKRPNVFLTAKEAKDIGLVTKINKVDAKEIKAFHERLMSIAAHEPITTKIISNNDSKINSKMTIEKLKAEHPEVYNQVFAAGVAQEKDRVESVLVFNEIDPKAVNEIVASGKNISQKQISELTLKSISAEHLKKIAEKSAPAITTGADPKDLNKSDKEKELDVFEKELRSAMNLK